MITFDILCILEGTITILGGFLMPVFKVFYLSLEDKCPPAWSWVWLTTSTGRWPKPALLLFRLYPSGLHLYLYLVAAKIFSAYFRVWICWVSVSTSFRFGEHNGCVWFLFLLFFGDNGNWTQGLCAEPHCQPFFFFLFQTGSRWVTKLPKQGLNLWSSCVSLP